MKKSARLLSLLSLPILLVGVLSGSSSAVSTGSVPHNGSVALALGHTGTPFGPTFWGQALPNNTPINPNSQTYVKEITDFLATAKQQHKIAQENGFLETTGAPPLYLVPASQPAVPVYIWSPTKTSGNKPNPKYGQSDDPSLPSCQGAGQQNCYNPAVDNKILDEQVLRGGVPINDTAKPASNNTDQTLIIYQPSTNSLWEMWKVQKDAAGHWEIGWGGKIADVSSSNGIFNRQIGTSATHDALLGVVTRIEELQAHQIDHPIDLELPHNIVLGPKVNVQGENASYSWPSVRKPDGSSDNPLAVPEGLRFRIDPSLNLNSLGLSPVGLTIAKAGQKYGFIVENSGPNLIIKIGNPEPYIDAGLPDPYIKLFNNPLGSNWPDYSYYVMANFPWSHLQALPFNYDETASSVSTSPAKVAPTKSKPVASKPSSHDSSLRWSILLVIIIMATTTLVIYRIRRSTKRASTAVQQQSHGSVDLSPDQGSKKRNTL